MSGKRALMIAVIAAGLPWAAARAQTVVPQISFQQFTLPNGLRVVLSEDHAVPVVTESLIFNVGGRNEQPGHSGFAHLFEHLMFEGSKDAPKGVFDHMVEGYGGDNNASTHTDYTFYYETVPSNALPILMWLDADRMAYLDVSEQNMRNQIAVVEEEKRLRVDNQPYGPLFNIDLDENAFSNWQNAHPVIGSFADLNAATLPEVRAFFDAYYAPRNAILVIVGDFDGGQAETLARRYFGWIPNRGAAPTVDTAEPPRTVKRRAVIHDPLAKLPALAIAWQGPPRRSPAFYALALLGEDLFDGESSRLYQSLVKTAQAAISVEGGLGYPDADYTDYRAPGLFAGGVIYKTGVTPETVEGLIYREIHDIEVNGMPPPELLRVKTQVAANWIRSEQTTLGRANLLAVEDLMEGSPAGVNEELRQLLAVTPEDIQQAAAAYLTQARETLLVDEPGGAPTAASMAATKGGRP